MESTAKRSSDPGGGGQRSRCRAAALIVYFDTSALIKTLLEEDGSQLTDELWSRSSARIASRLVYPEARAALAAARRGGRIDARTHSRTVEDLRSACEALLLIGVDWALAWHAGEIAEQHGLRGYDAVHLATALATDTADVVLATWDRELARAAAQSGLAVVPS